MSYEEEDTCLRRDSILGQRLLLPVTPGIAQRGSGGERVLRSRPLGV